MNHLKKFDIIESQTAQYTPSGATEARPFAQYFGVDEKKLNALSDEQYLELRRMNVLPVLYSQLISLANWRQSISRKMRRHNMTEVEAEAGNACPDALTVRRAAPVMLDLRAGARQHVAHAVDPASPAP